MADTKISALPASTTPLAGSETLPIVQGGVTKKVSVADLTAGRAPSVSGLTVSGLTASTALALNASKEMVSVTNTGTGDNVLATAPTLVGNVTLSTGNLVVADTKGIDFSATPGTGTSELLADYEEGTWTPSTDFATFVGAASSEGTYTKTGRVVVVRGSVTGATSVTVGASGILTGSMPFNAASDAIGTMATSTNTASGSVRTSGPFLVATDTISPVPSITFTATYFV